MSLNQSLKGFLPGFGDEAQTIQAESNHEGDIALFHYFVLYHRNIDVQLRVVAAHFSTLTQFEPFNVQAEIL